MRYALAHHIHMDVIHMLRAHGCVYAYVTTQGNEIEKDEEKETKKEGEISRSRKGEGSAVFKKILERGQGLPEQQPFSLK